MAAGKPRSYRVSRDTRGRESPSSVAMAAVVILLADTRDGRPLGPQEGPLRLIVPGDKRPARAVRQVVTITVRKD